MRHRTFQPSYVNNCLESLQHHQYNHGQLMQPKEQTNTRNSMTERTYVPGRPCFISHLCKICQVPAYVWRNPCDAVAAGDGTLSEVKVVVEPSSPAR